MRIFSTEQVSKYHPDKYADQISDALLTAHLRKDPTSHCGIEAMVKGNMVILGGEVSSHANVDYEEVVRRVAKKLNYQVDGIINLISKQSPEINKAVISDKDIGAGDQGIMFGYACNETPTYLPYAFDMANRIINLIEFQVQHNPRCGLKGDAKTQITVDLDTNQIQNVLISACHEEGITPLELRNTILDILAPLNIHHSRFIINPSGSWTIGGPTADCGLTGRKIVCDQYGGFCPVGGGAFSGKDPTKVDRSATYMARVIARSIVQEYGVKFCEVQLGYGIGLSQPLSVNIKTNLGDKDNQIIAGKVCEHFDLSPKGIINYLGILNWDFETLAEGCHFWRTF